MINNTNSLKTSNGMNIKKLSAVALSFVIVFSISAVLVYAQDGSVQTPPSGSVSGPSINATLPNPFKAGVGNSLFSLMKAIVDNILLPIGGVLAVMAFIYSGFLYVMAQGNESKLATAHKALLYTSIGTAILLGSWVLANVICQTIGQLGGPVCAP
ncbi:MAG: hypothetical protein WAX80_00520 [Minisyncoccia bacterium]